MLGELLNRTVEFGFPLESSHDTRLSLVDARSADPMAGAYHYKTKV